MLLLTVLIACVRPSAEPLAPAAAAPLPPRNVILMIGDGMGPQQLGLLEVYARQAATSPYADGITHFQRLGQVASLGLSLHHPADGLVTDSACSATQLALGRPSRNGLIGVDHTGRAQQNLREKAAAKGMATGIVSDTRLTHATPAAFLAHVADRSEEMGIAAQIVASDVDVALSGGRRFFVSEGGDRKDGRDLLAEAGAAGFDVVTDTAGLAAAGPRVLGLFGEGGMPDALSAPSAPDLPALATLTTAALSRLDADPDGFFLMVEGGQIDWAAHANDTGWMLAELQRFDAAVGVVLDYVMAHPDTLLVVTADHETGGFGLSPSEAMPMETTALDPVLFPDGYTPVESPLPVAILDQLARQPTTVFGLQQAYGALPDKTPEAFAALVTEQWGWTLSLEDAARVLSDAPMPQAEGHYGTGSYAAAGALAQVLSDQTGAVWNTSGHTHTPVPLFAVGPGSQAFGGITHHVAVGQALAGAVGGATP